MTVYVVEHFYDVEGEFGDAIEKSYIIAAFETEEEAEAFVAKYADEHIYDKAWASFHCGELDITPIEIGKYNESEFWWLDEGDDE